jgi:hypothetical protein
MAAKAAIQADQPNGLFFSLIKVSSKNERKLLEEDVSPLRSHMLATSSHRQ